MRSTSGLGLWGVARGVEWVLRPLGNVPEVPIPEPTELPPPTELSDMLLCVSKLFSCACDLVIVEKTDKSAVDVTLVSASDRLDPVCSQSIKELPSSILGSNENLEPTTQKWFGKNHKDLHFFLN